jgi:septum formation protein
MHRNTNDDIRSLMLASRSPRRRELLRDHGIDHEAEHPGFDDSELAPGRVGPAAWVASLAMLKASAGADICRATGRNVNWVCLGADTACVVGETLVGTPRDEEEAAAMIRLMSGRSHDVVTGVALVDVGTGRRDVFADQASVRLGAMGESEIRRYASSGLWQGKAGAYNLTERIAAGWPIEFTGDPGTIVGLPMRRLIPRLIAMGVRVAGGPTHPACPSHPGTTALSSAAGVAA